MAGFLDKRERIVDMVLTARGRRLLSEGKLDFVFWSAFDDEVDYNPVLYQTGSLSEADLGELVRRQMEETPVREPVSGFVMGDRSGSDTTSVRHPIFSMGQGQRTLPRVRVLEAPAQGFELKTKQRLISEVFVQRDAAGNALQTIGPFDRGFERKDPATARFELGFSPDAFPPEHAFEGLFVRVFVSGAEGLREVPNRFDLRGDVSYNEDLRVFKKLDGGT